MTPSAPRLAPRLRRAVERLDDGTMPLAELNRRVGAFAEAAGLLRPSYQQVRVLAQAARRRRRSPSTAEIAVVALYLRPPSALAEQLSGTEQPPLRERRNPSDK